MANTGYPEGVTPPPASVQNDPESYGRWLARQNPATIDFLQKSLSKEAAHGLFAERRDAFANGETLYGVDDSGKGLNTGAKETRALIAARSAHNPTSELDTSSQRVLHPEEGVTQLGHADPLQLDGDLKDIDQVRALTTGIDAQTGVLKQYQDTIKQGGLSAIDRARIAQSQQMRGTERRGQEGAIMQQAEEQGRAGGTAQLIARMRSGQTSSQARSMDDLQTNALALQNKQAMMAGTGQLAGQIQEAQDAIDKFNTQGDRDREKYKHDTENHAAEVTFGANVTNDREDAARKEAARMAGIAGEAGMHTRDTGATNTAEVINKGPSGGARGKAAGDTGAAVTQANVNSQTQGIMGEDDTKRQQDSDRQMAALYSGINDVWGVGKEYLAPGGNTSNSKEGA